MAPLPSNTTAVYFLDYDVGEEEHTLQMRVGPGTLLPEVVTNFQNLLTELTTMLYTITIIRLRYRAAGADITLPVDWSGDPTFGTGTAPHEASAAYLDFVGRSITSGRRVRASVFGVKSIVAGNDYRFSAGEAAWVGPAQTVLNQGGPNCWLAIDGSQPFWYPYADSGINAYWRNKIR